MGESLGFAVSEDAVTGDGTSSSVQLTVPCSMGGTVAVNGEANITGGDPESESLAVSLSLTSVHSDCVERHDETGLVFTLNGAPNLVTSLVLSASELLFELSGTFEGHRAVGCGRGSERILPDRPRHHGGDLRGHLDSHRASVWRPDLGDRDSGLLIGGRSR